jgi:hypothetical protein
MIGSAHLFTPTKRVPSDRTLRTGFFRKLLGKVRLPACGRESDRAALLRKRRKLGFR